MKNLLKYSLKVCGPPLVEPESSRIFLPVTQLLAHKWIDWHYKRTLYRFRNNYASAHVWWKS